MATETHIRDGAAWRKAKELHFRDGSVWRKAREVWVRDATAWRKVFTGGVVINPVDYIQAYGARVYGGASAEGLVEFGSDGSINAYENGSLTYSLKWFDPVSAGVGSAYWIKATINSGLDSNVFGPARNTWWQLNSARSWSVQRAPLSTGTTSVSLNIDIATDSLGTNIVASGTACVSLNAEVYI